MSAFEVLPGTALPWCPDPTLLPQRLLKCQEVRRWLHCPEAQGVRDCSLALTRDMERQISKMVQGPKYHVTALVLACWLYCFLPPTHVAKAERGPSAFSPSFQMTTYPSLLWRFLKSRGSSSTSEPQSQRRVICVQ